MKSIPPILALGVALISSLPPVSAEKPEAIGCSIPASTPTTPEFDAWQKAAKEAPHKYWQPYEFPEDRDCSVRYRVNPNGIYQDLNLNSSCWSIDGDVSAIEACWASLPLPTCPPMFTGPVLPPPPTAPFMPRDNTLMFSAEFNKKEERLTFTGAIEYFKKNPERKKTHFALHAIPLAVLDRYPGLFTREELTSEENVALWEKHSYDYVSSVQVHFERWHEFFYANKTASRKAIIALAKEITGKKEMFGDKNTPSKNDLPSNKSTVPAPPTCNLLLGPRVVRLYSNIGPTDWSVSIDEKGKATMLFKGERVKRPVSFSELSEAFNGWTYADWYPVFVLSTDKTDQTGKTDKPDKKECVALSVTTNDGKVDTFQIRIDLMETGWNDLSTPTQPNDKDMFGKQFPLASISEEDRLLFFGAFPKYGQTRAPYLPTPHASTAVLNFMIGKWRGVRDGVTIEETWTASPLNASLNCLRLTRDKDQTTKYSLLEIKNDRPDPSARWAIMPAEKENNLQELWHGSLGQRIANSGCIELARQNAKTMQTESMTFTYVQQTENKVTLTVKSGSNKKMFNLYRTEH